MINKEKNSVNICNKGNKTPSEQIIEEHEDKKKPKKSLSSKKEYFNILKHMKKSYPRAFTNPPSPLSIGIHMEIRKAESGNMSNNLINKFLFAYTRSKDYKKSVVLGANRVNLAGNVVSSISEKDLQDNT